MSKSMSDHEVLKIIKTACVERDIETIKQLLHTNGLVIDKADICLTEAVLAGDVAILELLLRSGMVPEAPVNQLLWAATISNNAEMVEAVFRNGVANMGGCGFDCAYEASARGYVKILKILINSTPDVDDTYGKCLRVAMTNMHYKAVKVLIKAGHDIDTCDGFLLRMAVAHGKRSMVKYLVRKGANVRLCLISCISNAINTYDTKMVRLLLDIEDDLHLPDGRPAIVARSSKERQEVIAKEADRLILQRRLVDEDRRVVNMARDI